jgi:hypothetical protein
MAILPYRLPIAVTSFNRPQYLKRCLESLERQTDLEDVEFLLIQDGVRNPISHKDKCRPQDVQSCIDLFNQSKLPNKTVFASSENLGIALNHHKAYEHCFHKNEFQAMVLSEDDLVYNEDWLRVTKVLLRQFQDDQKIATVQASCLGGWILDADARVEHRLKTAIGKPNWLGFGIWREKWLRMKPFFEEYLALVRKFDYQRRDHTAIRKWWEGKGIPETVTSQDRAKEWSAIMAGMCRIFTPANRAVYIGEVGIHGSPSNFKSAGYNRMVGTRIPGDDTIEEFEKPYNYTPEDFINISLGQCKLIEPTVLGG